MKFWPFKQARKPIVTRPVKVLRVGIHEIDLNVWQLDQQRVNWARTSEEFSDALAVVTNLAPTGFPVRGQRVTEIEAAVELGRKEGYADCLNVLLALRQLPTRATEQIEADYDNTDYETKDA